MNRPFVGTVAVIWLAIVAVQYLLSYFLGVNAPDAWPAYIVVLALVLAVTARRALRTRRWRSED